MKQDLDADYYKETIQPRTETIQDIPTARRRLLAALAIPLAWFFAYPYLEAPRGFHMALFWPVFLLVSLWFLKERVTRRDLPVILSALAVLAGSVHAALYASPEMNVLNFFLLPLLAVFCLILATRKSPTVSLKSYVGTLDVLLIKPLLAFVYTLPFLAEPKTLPGKGQTDHRLLKEILVGLLLSAPLLLLLVILLSDADAGFAFLMVNILDGFFLNFTLQDALERFLRTAVLSLYFLGVMMGVLLTRSAKEDGLGLKKSQSPTISLIILWSVDLVYLLFTLVQLRTLYFPREALDSMSQGIAHYARSGFFSLLLVLAINLFLLWLLSSITEESQKSRPALILGYSLMALFTANMIASSFYKMQLYELEYGYTYLRLFVKFALVFFSISLILTALHLAGRVKELLLALTVSALSLYIALSLINLDAIIARRASQIYASSHRLDTSYLSQLSADAHSTMQDVFRFDTTEDPQLLALQSQYTDNLRQSLQSPELIQHPLALTLMERSITP